MRDEDITPDLARLISEHPAIFRGTAPAVHSYVSRGWFDLIHRLCSDIETVLEDDVQHFTCRQIKEKFGALRFYWAIDGRSAVHVVDLLGRDEPESFETSTITDDKAQRIRDLVDEACAASESICESCGQPGRLRVTKGWYATRCAEHSAA